MHLVIATRADPSLPLARLRAQGQLTELRAADLRFTLPETTNFLNQMMGLNLSAEDIAALGRRTEGWVAGLQLAALVLQGQSTTKADEATARFIDSFTGSHRFILDYLIEEVLERQSESVQSFLLQTAILDRLTGSLCEAVCAEEVITAQTNGFTQSTSSGQATLEMLEHANLFIVPLDEERCWYRYHHLFADLLRRRLRQQHPEWVPTLHRRASDWYERYGFIEHAIEHALQGEDFDRAAHLIEEIVEAIWVGGEHTKLRRWLDRLPSDLVFSKPQFSIVHAWSLFAAGEQDAAEQSLQAVEDTLDASANGATAFSSIEQQKFRGRIAVVQAFMAFFREDVPGMIQHARQAFESLPEQDLHWRISAAIVLGDAYSLGGQVTAATEAQRKALQESKAIGNTYLILTAGLKLAVTLRLQGHLQQAVELCQQLVQFAQESENVQSTASGCLMVMWAEILTELDDLNRASELSKKGIELTRQGGDVAMQGWSYVCQVRILFSLGDMAGAEAAIHEMGQVAQALDVPPWITNRLAAWQGRIWLEQGKLGAVSQWVKARGLDTNDAYNLQHEREYMVLARLCILQGQPEEAIGLLDRLFYAVKQAGRVAVEIEILILQALARVAGGNTTRAVAAVEEALVIAEPGGFIRVFVDEGPSMAHLLYIALSHGIAPDYVSRLLAAFPIAEPEPADPSEPHDKLVEPLSERELEVLQLIADGLTNSEIAARLFLSTNTVKGHNRNIYGKLDVHSRTQAIARAQGLGLLSRQ